MPHRDYIILSFTLVALSFFLFINWSQQQCFAWPSKRNERHKNVIYLQTQGQLEHQFLTEKIPEFMSLKGFYAFYENARGIILDARPKAMYTIAHVPASLNLPREDFESGYLKIRHILDIDKDRPIAIYCSNRGCQDSLLVKDGLIRLGYRNISVFLGGWSEWCNADFRIESNRVQ
jgi:rhodanese-related sulfurtransferase